MQFTDLAQSWLILATFAHMSAASVRGGGKQLKAALWLVSDGLSRVNWEVWRLCPHSLLLSSRLVWPCSCLGSRVLSETVKMSQAS